MSILDWALENGIEDRPDYVKAEFAILSKLKNVNHPILSKLDATDPLYKGMISYAKGLPVSIIVVDNTLFEAEYLKTLAGGETTKYEKYDKDNLLIGLHQVFFDTNFGEKKKINNDYCMFLKSEVSNNHWAEKESIDSYYNYIDLVAECGLALRCLHDDLPYSYKQLLNTLDDKNLTWYNYHPFLVKEMYEAVS